MFMYLIYHFFFFNDTATTEIYTLSLHDALPILSSARRKRRDSSVNSDQATLGDDSTRLRKSDRKSTRLNSSHMSISYAVFCLKKKKTTAMNTKPKKTLNDTIVARINTNKSNDFS